MVSTRSHDSTPVGGASQPSQLLYPQVVIPEKKRKIGHEGDDIPSQAVSKKRRRSAQSNSNSTPSSNASKPGRPRNGTSAKKTIGNASPTIDHSISDREPSMQNSGPTSPQTPGLTSDQTLHDAQVDKSIEVAIKEPSDTLDTDTGILGSIDEAKLGAQGTTQSRRGRISKKRTKDLDEAITLNENGTDIITDGENAKPALATAAKATHKRFGSEDTEVLAVASPPGIEQRKGGQEDSSDDGSESGDEAPETVSASAGFDKARTSTLEAAKVATKYVFRNYDLIVEVRRLIESRQKAKKKLKRREHDQRLRLQAKSAKDHRSNDKPSTKARGRKESPIKVTEVNGQLRDKGHESLGETPKIIKDGDRKSPTKLRPSGKTPLPLLLPEELLATQTVVHTPTPSSSNSKVAISQKRRLLDLEPKPPKDIKRGNVTITVLNDKRSILPPKSSRASKDLRESWLTGRPGLKGKVCVPRQKPSGGFVRKNV